MERLEQTLTCHLLLVMTLELEVVIQHLEQAENSMTKEILSHNKVSQYDNYERAKLLFQITKHLQKRKGTEKTC